MKIRNVRACSWWLVVLAAPAAAQYSPPVQIPGGFTTGMQDDRRIEIGLAVDGSGNPPYPAAFFDYAVTDGTPAGTRQLENGPLVIDLAAIPNAVGAYIVGTGPANPTIDQLYYTDGTEAGTHIVAELVSAIPEGLRRIHGFVQGSVVLETQAGRLIVSDGTLAGTFEVGPDVFGLTSVERVSIGANQGFVEIGESQGSHILRFGASAAQTVEITPPLPSPFYASELTAFGDHACFVTGESQVGTSTHAALYCTDGTVAGTAPITQDSSGAPFGINWGDGGLQRFGSNLYFVPVWKPDPNSIETYESPWVTDGTAGGTHSLTIHSTMTQNRIGTADGRLFYSGYFQGTGLPFSVTDGNVQNTHEIVREPWEVAQQFRGDRVNPTLRSAVFFISREYASPDGYPQVRRTDGTAGGTFPMPYPATMDSADWRPDSDVKPVILGHYLLVDNGGTAASGIWSFDLDGIFNASFD